jgi:hypothetical protein
MKVQPESGDSMFGEVGLVADVFADDEQIGISIEVREGDETLEFTLSNDAAFALRDKLSNMLTEEE